MTILQIHNKYQKAGGEDFVVEAEKQLLEQQGHTVIQLLADNKSIYKIFFYRKQFYKQLQEILLTSKPDIAHIHNVFHIIGIDIYRYLFKSGIPIIQTLHNYRFLCPNGLFFDNSFKICELCKNGNFKNAFFKKCYQRSFIKSFFMMLFVKKARYEVQKYVSKFIVLSIFAQNKFNEIGFESNKIFLKPNFLVNCLSVNFDITYNNYILYIGRLSNEKDVESIIDVFRYIDFNIIIAGDGEKMETLKKIAFGKSNIIFAGYTNGESKEKLLANARFFIFSSRCYENFPISILEAFKYKKAVVASNLGSIPYIIDDGVNGILFEAGNPESLRNAVETMLEDENYKTMGENGYRKFIENYTDEQNYEQLVSIYLKIIGNNKLL